MVGWLSIERSLFKHPVVGIKKYNGSSNHKNMIFWIWLLSNTFYEDKSIFIGGKDILIKRGQYYGSVRFMAEGTALSIKEIRNILKVLKKGKLINVDNIEGQTMITVCKYNDYQRQNKDNNDVDKSEKGKLGASEGQAKGKRKGTKYNNNNNINNIESNTNVLPKTGAKENEPKRKQQIQTRFPTDQDFPDCPEKYQQWAISKGVTNWQPVWRKFFNHHFNKQTGQVSWYRTWQNWIANHIEWGHNNSSNNQGYGNGGSEGAITKAVRMAADGLGIGDEEPF